MNNAPADVVHGSILATMRLPNLLLRIARQPADRLWLEL